MSSRLIDGFATTAVLADVFSDAAVLAAMLRFEIALAGAQASLGIIPLSAADAIAKIDHVDGVRLAADARDSATLAIPFVKELTDRVSHIDADAAGFVHWGATSQDLLDTALILLLRDARRILR